MLLGFGTAPLFHATAATTRCAAARLGLARDGGVCRVCSGIGIYGVAQPMAGLRTVAVATVIDFLNVTKYPPSLLFLLMTLGPRAMLLARRADRVPEVHQDGADRIRPCACSRSTWLHLY
jgi:uncharacterized membrane protein